MYFVTGVILLVKQVVQVKLIGAGANSNRKRASYVKELLFSATYVSLKIFNRTVVIPFDEKSLLVITRFKPIKGHIFILVGKVFNFSLNKMASYSWQESQEVTICHGCNFFNKMIILFDESYIGD